MNTRRLCKHCKENQQNRPRGLCWTCYYAPGVREQYEMTNSEDGRNSNNRGYPDTPCHKRPLPGEPTEHLPGTAEKMEVMRERASHQLQLHHPLDARWGMEEGEWARLTRSLLATASA